MVLCEPGHHIGTFFGVIGDMDPGFPVVFTLLNYIVGDLGSTVVCGRVPGQADPLRKHLSEFDWSNRWARRSCRGKRGISMDQHCIFTSEKLHPVISLSFVSEEHLCQLKKLFVCNYKAVDHLLFSHSTCAVMSNCRLFTPLRMRPTLLLVLFETKATARDSLNSILSLLQFSLMVLLPLCLNK